MNRKIKQTIFVNVLIHNAQQEVLVVRRSLRDPFLPGAIELPGGRINIMETFEQALQRKLKNELSLDYEQFFYYTSLAKRNKKGAYVRVIFDVLYNEKASVRLNNAHHEYEWVSEANVPNERIAPDTRDVLLQYLGEAPNLSEDQKDSSLVIYSDGGSRGNPGPSAAGYVIYNQRKEILKSGGSYIGITNNSQAEYMGVLLALKAARQYADDSDTILCNIDSSMVVNQLNGLYKIKNRELWPFNQQIQEMTRFFQKVRFNHVSRESNTVADAKVNEILDAQAR